MQNKSNNFIKQFPITNPITAFIGENSGDELLFLSQDFNVMSFELLDEMKMKNRKRTYKKFYNKYSNIISNINADNYKKVLMPMTTEESDMDNIALKVYI